MPSSGCGIVLVQLSATGGSLPKFKVGVGRTRVDTVGGICLTFGTTKHHHHQPHWQGDAPMRLYALAISGLERISTLYQYCPLVAAGWGRTDGSWAEIINHDHTCQNDE
jgi:hypothetical protein